jgi:hypothetical protein
MPSQELSDLELSDANELAQRRNDATELPQRRGDSYELQNMKTSGVAVTCSIGAPRSI